MFRGGWVRRRVNVSLEGVPVSTNWGRIDRKATAFLSCGVLRQSQTVGCKMNLIGRDLYVWV